METGDQLAAGYQLQRAGKLREAERRYREVLASAPDNADAWCFLGMVLHDGDRFTESERAYLRSLKLDAGKAVTWNNLANTLTRQERLAEASRCLQRALALDPDYASAHHNLAVLFHRLGRLGDAIAACRRALALAPENAQAHKDLGVMLLLQGEWPEGWREYAFRFQTGDLPAGREDLPVWDGADVAGRRILLEAEQGLGDTIQFVRYAANLKNRGDCHLVLEAPKRMHALLRTFRAIDEVVARDDAVEADCRVPLLDLPGILGETPDSVTPADGYLAPHPSRVDIWSRRLSGPEVRVGLAWEGASHYAANALRNLPLRALSAFWALEGVSWFSLHRESAGTAAQSGNRLAIRPLGEDLDADGAFLDTAAAMQHLDLVITVDTSIAHLAGALGVPVWLALSHVPDWRWGMSGEASPWYKSMRLFRQPRRGDWRSVTEAMAEALLAAFPQRVTRREVGEFEIATIGPNGLRDTRFGLMMYNRNDLYIGRSIAAYGEFSRGEVELFRALLGPGSLMVDAGANIGTHTLALADIAGRHGLVHAFEPQEFVFQMLCANVRMNGYDNVRCHQQVLGEQRVTMRVPRLDDEAAQNFGGLSLDGAQSGDPIDCITIDSLGLSRCDLIKADVEGMELSLLRGAKETIGRCRPIVYVENDREDKSPALIRHLQSLDYRLFWHIVRLHDPANFYRNPENHFEGVVSVNMLCLPRDMRLNIEGLEEVVDENSWWRRSP